jgi:hypothetical protein
MNFTDGMEGQELRIDLKYCERCGGLWLRPQGTDGVYCASCGSALAAMPDRGNLTSRGKRRRKPRLPEPNFSQKGQGADLSCHLAHLEYLQGVARAGVSA